MIYEKRFGHKSLEVYFHLKAYRTFAFEISYSWAKLDHHPTFEFYLTIPYLLNFSVSWYDVRHRNENGTYE